MMNETNSAATVTYPRTKAGARRFLKAALAHVESASIRAWATSAHNGPLWEGEALARLKVGRTCPMSLGTCIVVNAMGM